MFATNLFLPISDGLTFFFLIACSGFFYPSDRFHAHLSFVTPFMYFCYWPDSTVVEAKAWIDLCRDRHIVIIRHAYHVRLWRHRTVEVKRLIIFERRKVYTLKYREKSNISITKSDYFINNDYSDSS